jgi:plastocyanin
MPDRQKGTVASLLAGAVFALAACSSSDLPSDPAAKSASPADEPAFSAATTHAPRKIAMLDDCDPSNTWPGGCTLAGGIVTFAQFQAALPLGHPSWRNQPSYLRVTAGKDIHISNDGGRPHTFTRVAAYGGGIVPAANRPDQAVAPECLNPATRLPTLLAGGGSMRIEDLEPGIHKYMCCFHPWMIAEIRVL